MLNKTINIGDTVRFLSTVGGGRVKGFLNKHLVMVEDEHGFDVPVLISECVVVEQAGNEKMGQKPIEEVEDTKAPAPKPEAKIEENDVPEETASGEKITACLAYLPVDVKNLSNTAYECYFVNDSNYYLFFNYMSRENNSWKSRYNGLVDPNTKIFLEEFDKTQLNDIEKICVQFIAFKHNKPFGFKNPCSVELRVDTVKFYKLHCFQENDYFDDNALIYYIIQNDSPERELLVSAGDIEQAIKEKQQTEHRPRIQRIEKKEKSPIIEIDLHINQLLDTTTGMDNMIMLEYQLNKFHEVMNENSKRKNQKIVFIHGKGDGVLKNAILKELKNRYKKCHYQDASFREYGYGATMVTIH
jgi:DNA-nicking Smr family endonuclease